MGYTLILFLLSFYANATDFTHLYPGTRATSMGSAFSSLADDPYGIFYNPAGLAQIRDIEISGGIARRRTTLNDMGEFSLAYTRPLPYKENGIFGFGYDSLRHSQLGNRDLFLFGYSDIKMLKYFQLPIFWGGNFRIVSIRYPDKSHLGIGFDGGIILRSKNGIRTGIVLSDLDLGLGQSFTTFIFANSYRYNDITYALDLRVRGGYAELFPGIEYSLYNDLFRLRAGKGININGKDYLTLGFGYQLEPIVCNFTYSIPWDGYKEEAGLYEISMTYKFGAASFLEKMVDDAATKLKELNSKIDDLNKQKNILEFELNKYQTGKGVLESELTLMQTRYKELQEKIKELEIEIIDAQFKKKNPAPKNEVVKPKEVWPKYHKVQSGDTLRSIAAKYYGDQNLWQLIYEANTNKINRGLPVEGATLNIPPPSNK